MRDVAPNVIQYPEVLHFSDDDDGLADEVSKVDKLWDETSDASGRRHMGAMVGGQKRVEGMIGSLDLLIRHKPVNHLWGAFPGVPGVVVGAGPGLDKNLHVLREFQDRCLIAGVNSSLPALDAEGIVPHFTVVCEAKPVAHSIEQCGNLRKTIMVPGIHVHRDTFSLPWLDIAPAISREAVFGQWITRTMDLNSIPIGGSSACLAAGVLYALGCDPIILIGNDCAQADSGDLYSQTAAFAGTTVDGDGVCVKSDAKLAAEDIGRKSRESTFDMVEVTAWDRSRKILAPMIYDGLRQWFEEVGEYWQKKRRIINATESGVHIWNWEHVSLLEAMAELPVCPRLMDAIRDMLEKSPLPDKGGMASAVDEQIEGAKKVAELCAEGLRNMGQVADIIEGVNLGPLRTWQEVERQRRDEQNKRPIMLEMADLFREHGQEEAVVLMERCREIQEEVYALGQSIDILDSWAWGDVEWQRRMGPERSGFEVLRDIFAVLEQGASELAERLTLARRGLE
jgi:hypothetical protein